MATKLGSDVGYRSGIYNGYKVIGTQTLGLRGLVLWLKFNEGSGNIAYDSSFYNNHGTIYGAVYTDGKFGKALSFDGVDDYVLINDSPELNLRKEITLIAWVKYTVLPSTVYASWEEWLGKPGYWAFTTNGAYDRINPYIDDENGVRHHTGALVGGENLLRWNMIAMTYSYDEGKQRAYVNGELVREKSWKALIEDGSGVNLVVQKRRHPKIIDEVRIYNRALSPGEIKMLYYNRIGAVPSKTI